CTKQKPPHKHRQQKFPKTRNFCWRRLIFQFLSALFRSLIF
ncbi:hypothetical protein HMPREF9104_01782, partial [Lentilactobacillus kisonensis F0435]